MGSKVKEEAIRNLIRTEAPDILLIQETKLEDKVFLQASKNLWSKSESRAISARGASGGIGKLWNSNKYAVIFEVSNMHWLLLKLQNLDTKEIFSLFNVYSPVNIQEKKECWDTIRRQVDLTNLENIIIDGDLNLTLHLTEKRGGNAIRDPTREWAEDLLQDCDLLDIKPSSGASFHANIQRLLEPACQRFTLLHLEEKLRRVKGALKRGAKTLSNLTTERKAIKDSLASHQTHMESTIVTEEMIDQETQLQQRYHKACLAEEEYWRLKSRNLWLKVGDRNTGFFHKQAQARKCFNTIYEIKEDNGMHKEFTDIKKATFSHFQNLYSDDQESLHHQELLDIIPQSISPRMNRILEAKITKEEAKKALFDMDPDKAPGPNGFSAWFLQICWPIVEKDLLKMIQKS
eukprot:PITA_02140